MLLSLAHLAKTSEGAVFFPIRLHLMFRGLKGISACSNPHCEYKNAINLNNANKTSKIIWLESITGKIEKSDKYSEEKGYIRLLYSNEESKENSNILTFKTCPKCSKKKLTLTDFFTKVNEPFFNLISEQFYIQPQTMFTEEEIEKTPNAGRKVLIFSNSRQRAAILAKDLTRAADIVAMSKAITLATIELQKWAYENNNYPTMNLLYVAFLKIAAENNLRFFYGDDETLLKEDILKIKNKIASSLKRKRVFDFMGVSQKITNDPPSLFKEQIIHQVCNNFMSLTDAAICYLVPENIDYMLDDIEDEFEEANVSMPIDEFKKLFSAWATEISVNSYALGSNINDAIRGELSIFYNFGLEENSKLPEKFKKILLSKNFSEKDITLIYEKFKNYLEKGESGNFR